MSTTNVYYNSWLVSDLKIINERGAKLWYEGVGGGRKWNYSALTARCAFYALRYSNILMLQSGAVFRRHILIKRLIVAIWTTQSNDRSWETRKQFLNNKSSDVVSPEIVLNQVIMSQFRIRFVTPTRLTVLTNCTGLNIGVEGALVWTITETLCSNLKTLNSNLRQLCRFDSYVRAFSNSLSWRFRKWYVPHNLPAIIVMYVLYLSMTLNVLRMVTALIYKIVCIMKQWEDPTVKLLPLSFFFPFNLACENPAKK